ncbi:transposase [Patescibacteria group bacterium]|nr:transposase [Patescibacteria group bacterium]
MGLQIPWGVYPQKAAVFFLQARRFLKAIFHVSASRQKKCQSLEGHVMPDPVHMCIAIPPKYPVSSVIGFLKGKSVIAVVRELGGRERSFTAEHLWTGGGMRFPPLALS